MPFSCVKALQSTTCFQSTKSALSNLLIFQHPFSSLKLFWTLLSLRGTSTKKGKRVFRTRLSGGPERNKNPLALMVHSLAPLLTKVILHCRPLAP